MLRKSFILRLIIFLIFLKASFSMCFCIFPLNASIVLKYRGMYGVFKILHIQFLLALLFRIVCVFLLYLTLQCGVAALENEPFSFFHLFPLARELFTFISLILFLMSLKVLSQLPPYVRNFKKEAEDKNKFALFESHV